MRSAALGSCASTDIARSECPVPQLGQRCRLPPVNVPSDSVRDSRAIVTLQTLGGSPETHITFGVIPVLLITPRAGPRLSYCQPAQDTIQA